MSPCKNCIYYRREENDKYPRCYFEPKAPGDIPPCEEDDFEEYHSVGFIDNNEIYVKQANNKSCLLYDT